jgi:transcriptional/translational regulatory protein YebC/TACO1
MAGHSKCFKVPHLKGLLDQKRGQLFSPRAPEMTVAEGKPESLVWLFSALSA